MKTCLNVVKLLVLFWAAGVQIAMASFVLKSDLESKEDVHITVKIYDGLKEDVLFTGPLDSGTRKVITTGYQGLALLSLEKGRVFPVIIGAGTFVVHINGRHALPSFTNSPENEFFYKLLTGSEPGPERYEFALLMIQAKKMLEQSQSIRTVQELKVMKEKYHVFVKDHYSQLRHSDMVRRLIAQYFMMHEYVDYHVRGEPATAIKARYKKAVLEGVGQWLHVLKPFIPAHEILNYCVSLYYRRSMVSLAHLLVKKFNQYAYCPGNPDKTVILPKDLAVVDSSGRNRGVLGDFVGKAVVSLVSDQCPVSKVETVFRARQLASGKEDGKIIVVPVGELTQGVLSMQRMLVKDNILFVKDPRCSGIEDVRLPFFPEGAVQK